MYNESSSTFFSSDIQSSPTSTPSFTISLPDTLGAAWSLGGGASLQLSLLATDAEPAPREAADDDDEEEGNPGTSPSDTGSVSADGNDGEPTDDAEEIEEPINLSIEVVDAKGRSAKVTLSNYGPIRRPLETRILRRADQEEDRFQELYEFVLQTFSIPLSDFMRLDPALDLQTLAEIRLVFDLSEAGTVVLDNVGIAFLDDAYTAVRVPADP